jgi:Tfp pilus assembly protein PilN
MQQVNLYQPILRQPKRVFSALAVGQSVLLIALALLAISAYAQWRVASLSAELQALKQVREVAEFRLRELQLRQPKKVPDPGVALQAAAVQAELDQTRRLSEALSVGAFGNTQGLSPYLVALSRQHVDGTSLTSIELNAGGDAVGLGGVARRPELVPEYLARLAREKVFAGKVFGQLKLVQADAGVRFKLATAGLKPGAKEAGDDEH